MRILAIKGRVLALLASRACCSTAPAAWPSAKIDGGAKLRIGWTAGGGVEWAFAPNWSAKLEYVYTDIFRDIGNNASDRHVRFHTIRDGVNSHFDLFSQLAQR